MESKKTHRSEKANRRRFRPSPVLVAIIVAVLVVVGLSVFQLFNNLAQKTAKPLEAALVQAGAIKKCDYGSAGRGPDNTRPWYNASFETSLNREQAVELLNKITTENGYKLTHASPENKGNLGVADMYLDDIYFDHTSKKSPFWEFGNGNIELTARVYDDGKAYKCGLSNPVEVTNDANHASIIIEVKLPDSRK